MKILVIKRDKLGDLLLATPMLAHLKASRPDVQLHLLTNDYNAWVAFGNPHVDRQWIYRRVRHGGRVSLSAAWNLWQTTRALRRERFDVVVVANGEESPRAIARGLSIRGQRTIAYCRDRGAWPGLSDALLPPAGMHEADRMLGMLAPLGIAAPATRPDPYYALPEEQRRFARQWLGERGLAERGYVTLGLGARRPKKQPSTEQILRWTRHWHERHGLATVFMWTPGKSDDPVYPGDDHVAQPELDAKLPFIHPFRGAILPALGLIWAGRAAMFPDSGLMHFAAASPGGVLGLFAQTDVSPHPSQWGPIGPRADFLDAPESVSELADDLVLARFEALLG